MNFFECPKCKTLNGKVENHFIEKINFCINCGYKRILYMERNKEKYYVPDNLDKLIKELKEN